VPHRLEPCRAADYPTRAVRPRSTILENARLKQAGLNILRDWRADLDEYAAAHGAALIAEVRAERPAPPARNGNAQTGVAQ